MAVSAEMPELGNDLGLGGELFPGPTCSAVSADAAAVAYKDAASSSRIIEDADEVPSLAVTWDMLRLDALPRAASLSLIEEAAR